MLAGVGTPVTCPAGRFLGLFLQEFGGFSGFLSRSGCAVRGAPALREGVVRPASSASRPLRSSSGAGVVALPGVSVGGAGAQPGTGGGLMLAQESVVCTKKGGERGGEVSYGLPRRQKPGQMPIPDWDKSPIPSIFARRYAFFVGWRNFAGRRSSVGECPETHEGVQYSKERGTNGRSGQERDVADERARGREDGRDLPAGSLKK